MIQEFVITEATAEKIVANAIVKPDQVLKLLHLGGAGFVLTVSADRQDDGDCKVEFWFHPAQQFMRVVVQQGANHAEESDERAAEGEAENGGDGAEQAEQQGNQAADGVQDRSGQETIPEAQS